MKDHKHIIIVDDDPAILDASKIILERNGYRITAFKDGKALLENPFEIPGMFILDKQLPGIDGLEICKYLKSREETKQVPVLILSASPQVSILTKDAHADYFLEKPFKMAELRKIVGELIL